MFIKFEACSTYVATVYITNFVNIHHSLLSMTQNVSTYIIKLKINELYSAKMLLFDSLE